MKTRKLQNGDEIELTHLSPCKNGEGTPNPYIGMSGVVHDLGDDKVFSIYTGSSWLCNISLKKCKFKYLS